MELYINNDFELLNSLSLSEINGGTFWGVVGGVATVIGGVATVVGGVVMLGLPDPTLVTKYGGYAAIVTGGAAVIGGIDQTIKNW